MRETKNRELTKIINGMEALGYQVDFIEMLPEGDFHPEPDRCLVNIKASPLPAVPTSESTE
jgi:hypothetical protein